MPLGFCGESPGSPDWSGEHGAAGLGSRVTSGRGWGHPSLWDRQGGAEGAAAWGSLRGKRPAAGPRRAARERCGLPLPPPGRRGCALPAAAAAAAAWAAPCPRWSRCRRRRELDADGARAGPWGSSASRTRSALLPLLASSFQGPTPPPREPRDVRPRLGPSPGLPPRPTPRSPQPSRCPWGPGDRRGHRGSLLRPGPQSPSSVAPRPNPVSPTPLPGSAPARSLKTGSPCSRPWSRPSLAEMWRKCVPSSRRRRTSMCW